MEKLTKVVDGLAWMVLFLMVVQISNCSTQCNRNKELEQINKSLLELNILFKNKENKE
jgi:hypothetical protein